VASDGTKTIHIEKLKKLIEENCFGDIRIGRVTQKDIECYLSGFSYNQHGFTEYASVCSNIFL
jgi:hypothetical protein